MAIYNSIWINCGCGLFTFNHIVQFYTCRLAVIKVSFICIFGLVCFIALDYYRPPDFERSFPFLKCNMSNIMLWFIV